MTDRIGTLEARHAAIGRLLADNGRLEVADVAELLGVAQETVRRDLRTLEAAGKLRRVHGGAIPVESDARVPIPTLVAPHPDEAALAERVWADLPRSGTVLIGSGPLSLAVTRAIVANPPDSSGLTVVTNSLDAAVHLSRVPNLAVYNVGGTVSPSTRAQEGDWALAELSRLRVNVAVLCPAGVSVEHGLSESTPAAAAIAQAEVECAERLIVICSERTLGRDALVRFARIEQIHQLLVSGRPDRASMRAIADHDVEVCFVSDPSTGTDRSRVDTISMVVNNAGMENASRLR